MISAGGATVGNWDLEAILVEGRGGPRMEGFRRVCLLERSILDGEWIFVADFLVINDCFSILNIF